MLHDLIRNMLGVKNTKLSKDTNVSILKAKTLLKQRNKVGKVAEIGVEGNNFVNMVGVFDNLETAGSSKAELLGPEASEAHSLPSRDIVRLGSSSDSLAVLLQIDVAKSKLRVVVDTGEEDLGCMVQALVEASVTNVLNVGNVRSGNELFHLREVVRLGIGVDELRVEQILLQSLASHLEIRNKFIPDLGLVGLGTDHDILAGVLGIDETLNSVGGTLLLELGLTEARPDRLLINLSGISLGAIKVLQEIDKYTNGRNLHLDLIILVLGKLGSRELLIDSVSLLVKHVSLGDADESNVLGIKVIELINVRGDTGSIGTDSGKDEKVLEIFIVREVRPLQNDTLEQSNEFSGEVGSHEGLDGNRNLISRSTLRKRPLNNLINQLTPVGVLLAVLTLFLVQNLCPKLQVLALNQVFGKVAVQAMSVTNGNEFVVAFAGTLLVGNESQRGVETLTVGTENLGIVEHIVHQESLRIAVESDVDFTKRIVRTRLSATSGNAGLKPRLEKTETIARLGNLNHFINRACRSDSHQNPLDEVLISAQIKQLANNLGGLGRRHLGNIYLNVLQQTVQV
mmetsp:Transcript_24893/g.54285  ORF Transcript_24893/g.54285 Transcript_24893/m.54285 type:complete len:569 (-) Transcript_24893:1135-2841(-)